RRLGGSQQERALEPYMLEGLADYSRFQRGNVGGDVGKFRHGCSLHLETAKYNAMAAAESSFAPRTAEGRCPHMGL
ncbi:MAG: hypothetical protein WB628_15395, partial [Candidatus Sulfotelmatobacter sp.]